MKAVMMAIIALSPALAIAQSPVALSQDDWSTYVLDDSESRSLNYPAPGTGLERQADSLAVLRAFELYHKSKALEDTLMRASLDSGYARTLRITPPSAGTLYYYHQQTEYSWQLLARTDAIFRQRWILK